jgi:lipopolysaccharide biosynthesis regulator YciM
MAAAHTAFVRGDFSDAARQYGLLLDCNSLSLQERIVLLCNRAAAYAAMDLNRKALNDADAALALDAGCLRALLIKGRASMELGRTDVAVDTWARGASAIDGDVVLVAEMAKLVAQQAAPKSTPSTGNKTLSPTLNELITFFCHQKIKSISCQRRYTSSVPSRS